MFKPPIFFECPSSLLTVGPQSSSCGVSIFLLWCFHFCPYGHHLYPFSGSGCSYLKGCVYTRGRTPWLGSSRHTACALLCGPASPSLTLGGESLLSSVLWEITLSSCVPVSHVTLPESMLTACLLGSGRTQSCHLLLPAYSYACSVRQGHLGSSTRCVMRVEMWQTWGWCKTVQKGLT